MTPGVNKAVLRKEVINMRHLNEMRVLLPLIFKQQRIRYKDKKTVLA